MLATSDLPGGVVNILTGRTAELAPVLAAHRDVDALDLAGAPAGLETGSRRRRRTTSSASCAASTRPRTGRPSPSPARMLFFIEIKTVWHPVGV